MLPQDKQLLPDGRHLSRRLWSLLKQHLERFRAIEDRNLQLHGPVVLRSWGIADNDEAGLLRYGASDLAATRGDGLYR
jgi:hypothetical protein